MRRVALALALLGCASPTELVVVVDSNLRVPEELDAVRVVIRAPDGTERAVTQSLTEPGAPGFPLTLGVAPEDDALGPITVAAVGERGGASVVRNEASVTLVSGSTRVLRLFLVRGCVGRDCAADESCGLEGCEPVARGVSVWDESLPPLPADPCLAEVWDADGDGEGSTACGGADCADDDPSVFAAQVEACDDVDNNCDGAIDETCPCTPIDSTRACQTDCMTEGVETCMGETWSACVPPTELCNGIDDNCDGLVDEGFTYDVAELRNASGGRALSPRIHWASDRFVVAWYSQEDPDGIVAMTMSPDGVEIAPPTRLTATDAQSVELATEGNVLAVAWHDREGCGTSTCDPVSLQLFALDTLSGISPRRTLENNADTDPRVRVVWDGGAFTTTYTDGRETVFRRHDLTGAEVGSQFETSGRVEKADVLWDGAGYRMVYSDEDLYMQTGTTMGFDPRVLVANVDQRRPEIVQAGAGYLVAYSTDAFPSTLEILAIDAMGVAVGGTVGGPLALSTDVEFGAGLRAREPGLAVAGAQAFVTWLDRNGGNAQPRFGRVTLDGRMIQASTPMTAMGTRAQRTTVATDGRAVWAAWAQAGDPRSVQLARLACPTP